MFILRIKESGKFVGRKEKYPILYGYDNPTDNYKKARVFTKTGCKLFAGWEENKYEIVDLEQFIKNQK